MSDEGPGSQPQPPPGQPPPGQSPPGQSPPGPPPPGQPPNWGQPPPPPPPPYGYGPPPPYGPQYGYARRQPQTEGTAITALVLSIASFMLWWLFGLGVVLAIVAVALCPSAKRKIDASGGALTGTGLVTAARIIGWINIGLTALVVVILVIVAIAGGFDDSDEFSLALSLLS